MWTDHIVATQKSGRINVIKKKKGGLVKKGKNIGQAT